VVPLPSRWQEIAIALALEQVVAGLLVRGQRVVALQEASNFDEKAVTFSEDSKKETDCAQWS